MTALDRYQTTGVMPLRAEPGLEQAFTQAVLAHRDAMFRLARNVLRNSWDAEDAVSDAIEQAWRAAGALRSWDSVRPWLMRIAYRCSLSRLRRARELPQEPQTMEALMGSRSDATPLWMYLEQLPQKARVVMHLRHAEGLPIDEIARVLRLPRGTVSSRLSRAERALAEKLRQEERDGDG